MKSSKSYLENMLDAIESIETYRVGSYEDLTRDEKTQDAIMFNLIILGEAANRLPRTFQDAHPELPWASIIGTRNVIVHGYDQIKLQIVWDILTKELGKIKDTLRNWLSSA